MTRLLKKNSLLIIVSGIDSSGKSTQIENLSRNFKLNGVKYKVVWSRGGYTSLLRSVKSIVRKIKPSSLPPPRLSNDREQVFENKKIQRLWLALAMLDLIRLYSITLRLYHLMGYNIICDRYLWDTYIDFKINFPCIKFEKWLLWKLLIAATPKPNISLILVISPEESLRRSVLKKEPFSENIEKRKKRYRLYMQLMGEGKWQYIIDGERPINKIWSEIKEILEKG